MEALTKTLSLYREVPGILDRSEGRQCGAHALWMVLTYFKRAYGYSAHIPRPGDLFNAVKDMKRREGRYVPEDQGIDIGWVAEYAEQELGLEAFATTTRETPHGRRRSDEEMIEILRSITDRGIPVITHVSQEEQPHAHVVTHVDSRYVYVNDSAYGSQGDRYTHAEYIYKWHAFVPGALCMIAPPGESVEDERREYYHENHGKVPGTQQGKPIVVQIP